MRLTQISTVPPGPYYDDAVNGLIARGIAYGGDRPVFTLAFTGREPLYHYVTAIMMRLVGDDLLALHLASFSLGMVAVAAMLAFGRAFFAGQRHARWMALLTGTLAATTFWPVSNVRFGLRAISFTCTIALLMWSLARWHRRGRVSDAMWTGVWAAATAYTYTANRVVPFALGLAVLWLLLRRDRHLGWQHIAAFAVAAAILFAPMGVFLTQHPEILTRRAAQVSIVNVNTPVWEIALAVLQGVTAALGAFGFRGDPQLILNVPGRPVFGVPLAMCFYLGLVILAVQAVSGTKRSQASGMVIIWFMVMLLPSALTIEPFHSLRSLGTLPVAMLLPVVAIEAGLAALEKYRPIRTWMIAGLWIALLIGTGTETYNAYFNQWARDPVLYSLRNGDLADLGRWFNEHDTDDAPIYITSFEYQHPTMALVARDYGRMKWAALAHTLVYPPQNREAYIGVPQSVLRVSDWLPNQLDFAERVAGPMRPDGLPAYLVYYVSPDTPRPQPVIAQEINFANSVRLLGYDTPSTRPGEVSLMLYWEIIDQPPLLDYGLVAHLVDQWGFRWTTKGVFNYPPEEWEPGEMVIHQLTIDRPPGLPPGEYTLELEWFSPSSNERLPVIRSGQFGGVYGQVGPLWIPAELASTDQVLVMQHQVNEAFGPLRLLGYDREMTEIYAGDILRLVLYWQLESQPTSDLQMTLGLEDTNGEGFQVYQDHPVHGSYPTSQWSEGEVVADRYAIQLGSRLPAGDYILYLRVEDIDARVSLGELMVRQSERLFETPPLDHAQTATFGEVVRLVGYDLSGPFRAGETITLRLVWQAISPPQEGYSTFVHVVDGVDTIVAQHDAVPRGDYPLFRWVEGEIVIDDITLILPQDLTEGDYRIRVGFYRPDTGERLPILESSGLAGTDFVWLDTTLRVR